MSESKELTNSVSESQGNGRATTSHDLNRGAQAEKQKKTGNRTERQSDDSV